MGKLSTIFSASEPESSSDKENSCSNSSNNTHPRSREFSSTEILENLENNYHNQILKDLENSGLSSYQSKILNRLKSFLNGITGIILSYEERYRFLKDDY